MTLTNHNPRRSDTGPHQQPGPVVTIAASYGCAGSVVAPRVATRLGLPFLDWLVWADPSTAPCSECLTQQEAKRTPISRVFGHLAHAAPAGSAVHAPQPFEQHRELRQVSESAIADLRAGRGGVILERAAAVVLSAQPLAFHVRLHGPIERRVAQGAWVEGIAEDEAARRMAATDRARAAYVRRLYGVDPADPKLYHLLLDSTSLPLDAAVEIIASAALASWRLAQAG